jgi:hypothetical protein
MVRHENGVDDAGSARPEQRSFDVGLDVAGEQQPRISRGDEDNARCIVTYVPGISGGVQNPEGDTVPGPGLATQTAVSGARGQQARFSRKHFPDIDTCQQRRNATGVIDIRV